MAGVAALFDGHILNKSKQEIDLNDQKYKGKVIGLYFSAHWFVSHFNLFEINSRFDNLGVPHVVDLLPY